jgi:GTP cyclohydrolase I
MTNLPDIQNEQDQRNIPLSKVGIREVILPFCFQDSNQRAQTSTGYFSLSVGLTADKKGVNMSRFMQILNEYIGQPISLPMIKTLLEQTNKRLESESAQIEIMFDYFVDKASPIVGITAPMAYQIIIEAAIIDQTFALNINTEIIASNCCPCSREISKYGAHNQRLKINTNTEIAHDALKKFCLKDFILDIEQASSCPVYPILKRPDEKYVTETQYENPKFVEDVSRDAIKKLREWKTKGIKRFSMSAEALESIHRHNAWAWHEE